MLCQLRPRADRSVSLIHTRSIAHSNTPINRRCSSSAIFVLFLAFLRLPMPVSFSLSPALFSYQINILARFSSFLFSPALFFPPLIKLRRSLISYQIHISCQNTIHGLNFLRFLLLKNQSNLLASILVLYSLYQY
jgi:hypothetical protein